MNKDFLYPIRYLHGKLHERILYEQKRRFLLKTTVSPIKKKLREDPDAVLLMMTPEHENLGDHAIAYAEALLLDKLHLNYIEVTSKQVHLLSDYKLLHFANGRSILLQGGGYLGMLWFGYELLLRDIILQNPKSTVIALPNTIYYSDSEEDQQHFRDSVAVYNRHKQLYLYAREKPSYDLMRKAYRNVKLVPDLVLSLNNREYHHKRNGCLLCLRHDCEQTRNASQEQEIYRQLASLFNDRIQYTDMVTGCPIAPQQREAAISKQLDAFSRAELVVTDRLHGMIFCAITGTACIVIDSKSPKVRGCYEWIKNLDYIRFIDDPSQIADAFRSIPAGEHHFDNSHLQRYYQALEDDILTVLKRR